MKLFMNAPSNLPIINVMNKKIIYVYFLLIILSPVFLSSGEPVSGLRSRLVMSALDYTGCSYTLAGTTRERGFDCLGLVYRVYLDEAGIRFPFLVPDLFARGAAVEKNLLQPGDLLFFNTMGYVSHVGMFIGDGEFVHAENENTGVVVTSLSSPYYIRTYAGARRYLQDTGIGGTGRFGEDDTEAPVEQDLFAQFNGYYETRFGPMVLVVMDSYGNTKGTYLPGDGTAEGEGKLWGRIDAEKSAFIGKWSHSLDAENAGSIRPGGEVSFYLTEDGRGLLGYWRKAGEEEWHDTWTGVRKF
jgi:hypothetical protein